MNNLINIFILINLVFAIYIISKSIKNRKLEIDGNLLFCCGFIFYWILPILIGNNGIFKNEKSMFFWFDIYNRINSKYILIYLINSFLLLIAFYLGGKLLKKTTGKYRINKNLDIESKYLDWVYFINIVFLGYFVFKFRKSFFKGYGTDLTLTLSKGTFVAVSLFMLVLSVMYIIHRKQKDEELSFFKVIINKFTITYFTVASLILTLGGRMYILGSIIIYLVIYTRYFKKLRVKYVMGICFLGVICAGAIGIIRQGGLAFDVKDIVLNVCLESLYTFYSTLAFLYLGFYEILKFPIYFLSDFINLIPSFILPNKLDYLIQPEYIFNPQGALSSYVSFMMNFGIIGSGFVLFIIGYAINYLKSKKNNLILGVFYVMICGWIPFTFFRDEFFVSVIKNILEFSVVIPFLIWGIAYILSNKRYKKLIYIFKRGKK